MNTNINGANNSHSAGLAANSPISESTTVEQRLNLLRRKHIQRSPPHPWGAMNRNCFPGFSTVLIHHLISCQLSRFFFLEITYNRRFFFFPLNLMLISIFINYSISFPLFAWHLKVGWFLISPLLYSICIIYSPSVFLMVNNLHDNINLQYYLYFQMHFYPIYYKLNKSYEYKLK